MLQSVSKTHGLGKWAYSLMLSMRIDMQKLRRIFEFCL